MSAHARHGLCAWLAVAMVALVCPTQAQAIEPVAPRQALTVLGTPMPAVRPGSSATVAPPPAGYTLSVIDGSLIPLPRAGTRSAPTGLSTVGAAPAPVPVGTAASPRLPAGSGVLGDTRAQPPSGLAAPGLPGSTTVDR